MTAQTNDTTEPAVWAAAIERLANRPLPEEWITLHDRAAVQAVAAARVQLTRIRREVAARHTDDDVPVDEHPNVVAAQAVVDEKTAAAADLAIEFHLRAMRPDRYDALQRAHPPTDDQAKLGMVFNPETFFPALVASCSVKPLTVDQATDIVNAGTRGDAGRLFMVCRNLNESSQLTVGRPPGRTTTTEEVSGDE
ncbi:MULTISPECIES: hypothetical protein [unclassified Nocardioides]|uniref:hypothetical protein n=1 Tax=unclassified Nocardioides TaxID=2615069 RepID=UPI00070311B7|nr:MULTISPECIES: hypothetical protein [unclassified Nocardioides]KRC53933.1 hypothetical protein ASE19_07585 [Nocardioides sp. Root79]KRC71269.1 hypothetical protein ASE20_10000 [Nocardioides sp. Root240]